LTCQCLKIAGDAAIAALSFIRELEKVDLARSSVALNTARTFGVTEVYRSTN
jgi:hypothetical protein